MKAIIIAGGEGTRLRPLTYWKPKPLLPLWGIPMIEIQISKLRKAGIKEIIINVGYKAEAFERHFSKREGITLSYESSPMGTAGAVKLAEDLFKDSDQIIVLNADIVTDFDYRELISFQRNTKSDVSLFSVNVDDPSRFGLILTKPGYRQVEAFLEKTPKEAARKYTDEFYINGGIYVMKANLFHHFDANRPLSFEKEVFPTLIMKGYRVSRFDFKGYWLDVGTKESYWQAHKDMLRKALLGQL